MRAQGNCQSSLQVECDCSKLAIAATFNENLPRRTLEERDPNSLLLGVGRNEIVDLLGLELDDLEECSIA